MTTYSQKVITLVPVGTVPGEPMRFLQEELRVLFGARADIGSRVRIPSAAQNNRRRQLRAQVLLGAIASGAFAPRVIAPGAITPWAGGGVVLGIVDRDLYVPGMNFVFGIAAHRAALVSLYRLHRDLPPDPGGRNLFLRRVLTEAVHELGHVYGLSHCPDASCVMFFSNSLADTDAKGIVFCHRCTRRLDLP
jgi:archaemetzincin